MSKTKPELVTELKARGLSHAGTKAELVKRLEADDASKATAAAALAPDPVAVLATPAPRPRPAAPSSHGPETPGPRQLISWNQDEGRPRN